MRGVRIPQGLTGEEQFVLGLSVQRLAALLLGLLAAYTILHLALPAPIQLLAATFAALTGAATPWGPESTFFQTEKTTASSNNTRARVRWRPTHRPAITARASNK